MKEILILGALLAVLPMLSGCSFTLHFYGGDLVNPLDPQRLDAARNSQELAFRVYQLKDHDKIKKVLNIPWEAFVSSELPEGLHPFLTVPADTKPDLRPQEDFYIQRQKHRRVVLELVKGTRWLLVVPRGGRQGERSSMALVRVDPIDTSETFCFDRYDVFQRRSRLWPCRRDIEEE
jgi:hypothetical protein